MENKGKVEHEIVTGDIEGVMGDVALLLEQLSDRVSNFCGTDIRELPMTKHANLMGELEKYEKTLRMYVDNAYKE